MRFKRNEPFRYHLKQPISCEILVIGMDDKIVESTRIEYGKIVDISLNGLGFISKFEIPCQAFTFRLKVTFTLSKEPIELQGTVKWGKHTGDKMYAYGMYCENDKRVMERIKKELREISRKAN